MRKKLPVGIENFEEFSSEDFYYVDKTMFLKELLQNWGKVNLFTRPRRFGKSLNMSMLKCFFEVGTNPALFEGLKIMQERELCEKYMGKFPVISISLKSVDGLSYQCTGYSGSDEYEGEFLPRDGVGAFKEPGKLADPVQRRAGRGIQ